MKNRSTSMERILADINGNYIRNVVSSFILSLKNLLLNAHRPVDWPDSLWKFLIGFYCGVTVDPLLNLHIV